MAPHRTFKVVLVGSDGSRDDDDEVFDTWEAVQVHGFQCCSDDSQGATLLRLHSPGNQFDLDDRIDYEVIEIE